MKLHGYYGCLRGRLTPVWVGEQGVTNARETEERK